jgi:hypothetical protein
MKPIRRGSFRHKLFGWRLTRIERRIDRLQILSLRYHRDFDLRRADLVDNEIQRLFKRHAELMDSLRKSNTA